MNEPLVVFTFVMVYFFTMFEMTFKRLSNKGDFTEAAIKKIWNEAWYRAILLALMVAAVTYLANRFAWW